MLSVILLFVGLGVSFFCVKKYGFNHQPTRVILGIVLVIFVDASFAMKNHNQLLVLKSSDVFVAERHEGLFHIVPFWQSYEKPEVKYRTVSYELKSSDGFLPETIDGVEIYVSASVMFDISPDVIIDLMNHFKTSDECEQFLDDSFSKAVRAAITQMYWELPPESVRLDGKKYLRLTQKRYVFNTQVEEAFKHKVAEVLLEQGVSKEAASDAVKFFNFRVEKLGKGIFGA